MGIRVKKEKWIVRHRFSVFFFVFTVLYNFIIANRMNFWEVDNYDIYSFYAVDYSYGFAGKLLVGAVFRFICGSGASRTAATVYATFLVLLFFAGLSVLLEKFVKKMPAENRTKAFALLMCYLTGGYTFSVFTKTLGLMDFYWILCSLLFFFLIENKWLRYLIPLVFTVTVLVHNGVVISYMILLSLVLLYKISALEEKKEKRIILSIFVASLALSAALLSFLAVNESKMICSIDVFHEKLLRRDSTSFRYYDYLFYDLYEGKKFIPDSVYFMDSKLLRLLYIFYYRVIFNFGVINDRLRDHICGVVTGCAFLIPFFAVFANGFKYFLKQKENRLKAICAFLAIVQIPFTFITSMLLSEDVTRWLTHTFLISFSFLIYLLCNEEEFREYFFSRISSVKFSIQLAIFMLAYFSFNFLPIF